MKNKLTLLFALVVSALTLAPHTAQAGRREDKVLIGVGSFIGGVIVGSHLDRNRDREYSDYRSRGTTVVISSRCEPPPPPCGYWEERQVRVWVPARRIVRRDDCGRRIVVCQPGYYTYETTRVWVATGERRQYRPQHDDYGWEDSNSSYASR